LLTDFIIFADGWATKRVDMPPLRGQCPPADSINLKKDIKKQKEEKETHGNVVPPGYGCGNTLRRRTQAL